MGPFIPSAEASEGIIHTAEVMDPDDEPVLDAVLVVLRLGALFGTRRAYRAGGAAYWLSPIADAAAVVSVVRSATSSPSISEVVQSGSAP